MELSKSTIKEDEMHTTDVFAINEPEGVIPIDFDDEQVSMMNVPDLHLHELLQEHAASMFLGQADTKAEIHEGFNKLATRDDLLVTIHAKLAKYEEDFFTRCFLEPLTRRVASIHRTLARNIVAIKRQTDSCGTPFFDLFEKTLVALQIELENILNTFGVEVFNNESEEFNRSCQEATEKREVHDVCLVGMIAKRVSPGFKISERIIVREQVIVFSR